MTGSPIRSARHPRHNLRPQRTPLIGREREIVELRNLLSSDAGRLVTLTGAGGCGKTRLAVSVAAEVCESFQDGAWLVELGSLKDPTQVPQVIAAAFGMRERAERAGRPLPDALVRYLAPRQLLLVLDNCEHLISACAELVDRLLQACPKLRVLATSREVLRIAGEVTWRVPPLAVPDPRSRQSPADLLQIAAVRLFVTRAQAVQPSFELTSQNAPAVAAICARLEGLPLAIELAAAWERALGIEDILERLDNTFQILAGGDRSAPTRQQTMWATLDWSYALLAEPERVLFRRLAVFVGGWTLQSAQAVCAGDGLAGDDVLGLLTRLIDTSLVLEEERDGHARYRFLEPVRAFAAERLAASGELEVMRGAHAAAALALAQRLATEAHIEIEDLATWGPRMDQMEQDYANFRAALEWLSTHGPAKSALRLANALSALWQTRGYLSEGRGWMDRLLREPDRASLTRAMALGWAGNFAWFQGDPLGARVLHLQALAAAQQIGSEEYVTCVLGALGRDALALGDYAEAERLSGETLNRCETLEPCPSEEGWTLYTLGMTAYARMDWERARAFHSRCLDLASRLGTGPYQTAQARYGLACAAHQQGDWANARRLYQDSLADARKVGRNDAIVLALVGLGRLSLETGDLAGARATLTDSLMLSQEVGSTADLARALEAFASLAVVERDPRRALRLIGAAEALRATGQTPLSPAEQAQLEPGLDVARAAVGEQAAAELTANGRTLSLDEAVALAVEGSGLASPASVEHHAPGSVQLTTREREVAALLAGGLTNRQIADRLVVTERTVAAHIEHILDKLGFASRHQVGTWAVEHGLSN